MLARSLLALVVLAACQSSGGPAARHRDGGAAQDAGVTVDATARDAAPMIDAGPPSRDVRPPVEVLFDRLGRHDIAAIWTDAHPTFLAGEDRRRAQRMMKLLVEPLGGFEAIEELHAEAGKQAGDNRAVGTARFQHGVARYEVVLRDDHDVPRLLFFNVELPPALRADQTPAEARALVERATRALLTGELERFRPLTHPALDEKLDDAQARELKTLAAKIGAMTALEVTKQEECKGQCFVLIITGTKAKAVATFKLTRVFGRWHVLSFDLELA